METTAQAAASSSQEERTQAQGPESTAPASAPGQTAPETATAPAKPKAVAAPAKPTFREQLRSLINKSNREAGSNTPDDILAKYIEGCLALFDQAVKSRDRWYGVKLAPGKGPAGAKSTGAVPKAAKK